MEGIGFALGVIPEIRHQILLIKARIDNYEQGPAKFQELHTKLGDMTRCIAEIDHVLSNNAHTIPEQTSSLFLSRLQAAQDSLQKCESVMSKFAEDAFHGSTSGKRKAVLRIFRRAARANSIAEQMSFVETQIQEAFTVLNALISELSVCVRIANVDLNAPSEEARYSPVGCTPAPSHTVRLDFDEKDAHGGPITPEGELKLSVLSSPPELVTSATGAIAPAYGVVGMAGVGKTIALQGLAYDEEIKNRFADGIHYISLGQATTKQSAIQEIFKILRLSGAKTLVQTVENCSSVREAVDYAVSWFQAKNCLYLVDDVWPSETSKTGFLNEIRQLLRASPDSRMAISTRSIHIAQCAGLVVNFGARDPLGAVSAKIFFANAATSNSSPNSELRASVTKILLLCAGLPIAISVAGCAVALLVRGNICFEVACDSYAIQLERKIANVGEEDTSTGRSLNAGIFLSLEYLDGELQKKNIFPGAHTMCDLYSSLCVVANQSWIPVSALSKQWNLDESTSMYIANRFCEMSLATLSYRKNAIDRIPEPGILLHDLHLEFCRTQAAKHQKSYLWHTRLLDGYLRHESAATPETVSATSPSDEDILSIVPRPWWSSKVPDDGYIHEHLARHLCCSGRLQELAALLIHARWIQLRNTIGGMLSIVADFDALYKFSTLLESFGENYTLSDYTLEAFRKICQVIQLSWGRISDGFRPFQFHVSGRLHFLRGENVYVGAFLNSIEACTPKPHLLHISSCFPDMKMSQEMEIPVGGPSRSAHCSGCGRYIVAGSGKDIVIINFITGNITRRLQYSALSYTVLEIRLAAQATRLISHSGTSCIMVWDWESSSSPIHILKEHSHMVTALAISRDGKRVFSGSQDKTLRVWDGISGKSTKKAIEDSFITSLDVCREERAVALGLRNGTITVLDSLTMHTIFEDKSAHRTCVRSIAFSQSSPCLVTSSLDKAIRVWDTNSWTEMSFPIFGHNDELICVALSLDGTKLVSVGCRRSVLVWDLLSGISVDMSAEISLLVRCASFDSTGNKIICAAHDGVVRVCNPQLAENTKMAVQRGIQNVQDVSIIEEGEQLVTAMGDGTLHLLDSRTCKFIKGSLKVHCDTVNCLALCPEGRQLVSGSADSTLHLWDSKALTPIGEPLQGHSGPVSCVSFSYDGHRIISGSQDCSVRFWDVNTGKQIGEAVQIHNLTLVIVAECSDKRNIVFRDVFDKLGIWNTESKCTVWRSDYAEGGTIRTEDAESIVSKCGSLSSRLWSSLFRQCPTGLFCSSQNVYFSVGGEAVLLANLPSTNNVVGWAYNERTKVFTARMSLGYLSICKLVTE